MRKRIISCIIALLLIVNILPFSAFADETEVIETTENNAVTVTNSIKNYDEYNKANSSFSYGTEKVLTSENIVSKSDNIKVEDNINDSNVGGVIIPDDGYATFGFTTELDSLYIISVKYMSVEEASGNMELELNIDGKIPFSEVSIVTFERTFEQKTGEFEKSSNGNDIKPEVKEIFVLSEKKISDSSGFITEPFSFGFSAGSHTLSLKGSRGKIAVNEINLIPLEKISSYEEYTKDNKDKTDAEGGNIEIEAEHLRYKSSVSILPATDRSSAATSPQSPSALLLNTLGGDSWKSIGDSVVWEFEVKKSGMYEISTRFLQNTKDGIFTCRKLYIDGEVPFKEANSIRFDYDSDWQCQKIGNKDKPYKFYLEKGKHTLTLEATAGEVADIISTVSNSITELNRINRRIKLITGDEVDTNRDYNFKALIPDEIKQMAKIKDDLQKSVDYINKQAGANGSFVSVIQKVIFQLDKMSTTPRLIPKYLERFQSNLGSMGEWLLSAIEQPLKLDKIYIQPVGNETPKAKAGFFKAVSYGIKNFLYSYATDYNTIGAESDSNANNTLTVWVQTGRDQGQVVRDLVDASFAKQYNANVKIQVVSSGLLQSVLAGISPDVVTNCAETLPLEYALRNAVLDMSQFDDYEEAFSKFIPASIKPATFDGKVYGMPQTYSYLMMFYRTDIFEEFGYTVPATWDELRTMIPSLQRNGMEVGMPHTLDAYATILYQNGGKLYKGNGVSTNLNDYTSIVSFANLTEFFTLYDCPVTYNFANRFRSGEMPIALAAYTEYNQLTAFAPEIKGMWKMVPIPGTKAKDGAINNTAVGNSTFSVIMKSTKNKELAWEFLKWFMSTDVQSTYAIRMESILGTCAKVDSANYEALSKMTWSSSEYKELFKQMENVDSVPQVPGGYYLSRIVGFAFNRVYNNDENPKEVLRDYIKELNDELTRKREEFGLED